MFLVKITEAPTQFKNNFEDLDLALTVFRTTHLVKKSQTRTVLFQFMKPLNYYLKFLTSFAGISGIAIATMANAGSAKALSFDDLKAISQTNRPPEVIVDYPNSIPRSPSTTAQNTDTDTRFSCQLVNGEYTVMYSPESQPNEAYPWAIPSELGGGWTPQRRCNAITERFETYRDEGLLELATGTENGYDTICVTTQLDPSDCKLILTVPPGQDPQLTRDLIFDNLLVADDGQQTQGVYTFGDSQSEDDILGEVEGILGGSKKKTSTRTPSGNINLKPFLDPADGGTGEQLTNNNSVKPRPNSNRQPDLFKNN